ncbi:MAG: flagellar biosynthetic protein FliO [Desulfobacterium sp.]|nr:flagellar biosynthetic protein FliO [Desulfobacterium sp.]
METSSEMWGAFLKSAVMLGVVIAALVLLLYVVRRFTSIRGAGKGREDIRVAAVHHLAPKEKLVLVDVLDRKILLGVTSQTITSLATFDGKTDVAGVQPEGSKDFSDLLQESVDRSCDKGDDHGV